MATILLAKSATFGKKPSQAQSGIGLNEILYEQGFLSREQKKETVDLHRGLETLDDFQIYFGKYQSNPRRCPKCGFKEMIPNEKMTDVNIAVEMMTDAFQDRFDTALLISADSDLSAPVKSIKSLFPDKRIVIAFPPQRHSVELQKQAHATIPIGRANVAKSIFPSEVQKSDGFILKCPESWMSES